MRIRSDTLHHAQSSKWDSWEDSIIIILLSCISEVWYCFSLHSFKRIIKPPCTWDRLFSNMTRGGRCVS